jgi:excisionase family DNA binding protein
MSVKAAAALLEVSVTTVYGLVAAGKLRCYRVGVGRGRIRIAETHINEYLGKAESAPVPPAPASPPPSLRHIRLR